MEEHYSKELTDLVKKDCFIILNQLKNLCSNIKIYKNSQFDQVWNIESEIRILKDSLISELLSNLSPEELKLRIDLCLQHTKQNLKTDCEKDSPYFYFLRSGFGTAIEIYLILYLININLNKNSFKLKEKFLRKIPLSSMNNVKSNKDIVSLQKPSHMNDFKDDYISFLNDKMFILGGGKCPIVGEYNKMPFSQFSYETFFPIFKEIISKNFGERIRNYEEQKDIFTPEQIKKIPVFYRFFLGLIPFNIEHLEKHNDVFEKIN